MTRTMNHKPDVDAEGVQYQTLKEVKTVKKCQTKAKFTEKAMLVETKSLKAMKNLLSMKGLHLKKRKGYPSVWKWVWGPSTLFFVSYLMNCLGSFWSSVNRGEGTDFRLLEWKQLLRADPNYCQNDQALQSLTHFNKRSALEHSPSPYRLSMDIALAD